jgi:hypothetical protein
MTLLSFPLSSSLPFSVSPCLSLQILIQQPFRQQMKTDLRVSCKSALRLQVSVPFGGR